MADLKTHLGTRDSRCGARGARAGSRLTMSLQSVSCRTCLHLHLTDIAFRRSMLEADEITTRERLAAVTHG